MVQEVVVWLSPLELVCAGFMVDKVALEQFASVWYPPIFWQCLALVSMLTKRWLLVLQLDRLLILYKQVIVQNFLSDFLRFSQGLCFLKVCGSGVWMTASVSSGGMILTGEDKIGCVTYNVTLARCRNHCCYRQATVRSVYCWATCHCQRYKDVDCLSYFNQIWSLSTDFPDSPSLKIVCNPSSWSRADTWDDEANRTSED